MSVNPVTVAAVSAAPVKLPVKTFDVKLPSCGLYVSPVSDSNPWFPVAPSTKTG